MNLSPKQLLTIALVSMILQGCGIQPDAESVDPAHQNFRFATFNIAMGLEAYGEMAAALQSGEDARLKSVATVLQVVRPDVVLLAEFDYDPAVDAADLLNRNYLQHADEGLEAISYTYSFRPTTNTGIDSGLDLNSNGKTGEPADAWGFGTFPGQYGMLILSQHPIEVTNVRSFQTLRWADLPNAHRPVNEDGSAYYPDEIWEALRLSSKNHIDLPISLGDKTLHFLVSHPTPPVFDGPEDRNGRRNHDELSLWVDYLTDPAASWIVDDVGKRGGLSADTDFIIGGDLNADPFDGGALPGAIDQLLEHPSIDASCTPTSPGGVEASNEQAGINLEHSGDPATDTSDFNDETTGNYRLDYLLPSRGIQVNGCGVFWPASDEPHYGVLEFSDHRLVWLEIGW
jgi:hypothetical protein